MIIQFCCVHSLTNCDCFICQLFRYVEQAEWAAEVMKATGKPVAVCLSVSLAGDMTGVLPGECAVRVARAGKFFKHINQDNTLDCPPPPSPQVKRYAERPR